MMDNKKIWILLIVSLSIIYVDAQTSSGFDVPAVSDPAKRLEWLKEQWEGLQEPIPKVGVRDCFLFLLDALDTKFLSQEQLLWTIELVKTRIITDTTKPSYGNMYWGWTETGGDVGDGNNVEFCIQYGILIKFLFDERLSAEVRNSLDDLFSKALIGVKRQPVRISYTNIYVMRVWNLMALGQVFQNESVFQEGLQAFDIWLNHIAHFGNREFDSPTYSGVDLESLLLMHQFIRDTSVHRKVEDVLKFFLIDLAAHYNPVGGFLAGAHSRDYNRVFGRDLLEEKYFNPLLGSKNNNNQLFHQVCFSILKNIGLSSYQKSLMQKSDRFILQRWDSLPHSYASDYQGKKYSIASSNQYYSPDDKSFVIYLNSPRIKAMPNLVYVMEGRNDHYGTWQAEGLGEKLKHKMPPNYPSNGGWGKTRHLMPFMQVSQHKNEFVMLVSGEKDHNCINPFVNSTIILPAYFDELWMGNRRFTIPEVGDSIALDSSQTFFGLFEDVAVAIRILWHNAEATEIPRVFNDGFKYSPHREFFQLEHNQAFRLTLKHPDSGKGIIAMWWKAEENINTDDQFKLFRNSVLNAPVTIFSEKDIIDVSVQTKEGKLGVRADVTKKKRLSYDNPIPVPKDFLFLIDGVDYGKKLLSAYR